MKIAINGDIIDTNNIYRIHNIFKDNMNIYRFRISMFNDITLYVGGDDDSRFYEICKVMYNKSFNKLTKLERDDIDAVYFQKLFKLRNSIIEAWSENQSNIPQFNL